MEGNRTTQKHIITSCLQTRTRIRTSSTDLGQNIYEEIKHQRPISTAAHSAGTSRALDQDCGSEAPFRSVP